LNNNLNRKLADMIYKAVNLLSELCGAPSTYIGKLKKTYLDDAE